jgi:hypothetical protein
MSDSEGPLEGEENREEDSVGDRDDGGYFINFNSHV